MSDVLVVLFVLFVLVLCLSARGASNTRRVLDKPSSPRPMLPPKGQGKRGE